MPHKTSPRSFAHPTNRVEANWFALAVMTIVGVLPLLLGPLPAALAGEDTSQGSLIPYATEDRTASTFEAELALPIDDPNDPRAQLDIRIIAPTPETAGHVDIPEAGIPVIVFSHGLAGSNNAFPQAARLWASHGYVVALPTHADSMTLESNRREMRRRARASLINRIRGDGPEPGTAQSDQRGRFEQRAADQRRILDELPGLIAQSPLLIELSERYAIDTQNTASAGHSFGALTCQLRAGATMLDPETGERWTAEPDPRVKCVAPVSPQGAGHPAFFAEPDATSWDTISVPMLVVTGTNDDGRNGQSPDQRQDPFRHAARDAHLLFIDGAFHSSFQHRDTQPRARAGRRAMGRSLGISQSTNPLERDQAIARHTRTVMLAFFDAILKNDPEAQAYLASDGPTRIGESTATWARR